MFEAGRTWKRLLVFAFCLAWVSSVLYRSSVATWNTCSRSPYTCHKNPDALRQSHLPVSELTFKLIPLLITTHLFRHIYPLTLLQYKTRVIIVEGAHRRTQRRRRRWFEAIGPLRTGGQLRTPHDTCVCSIPTWFFLRVLRVSVVNHHE